MLKYLVPAISAICLSAAPAMAQTGPSQGFPCQAFAIQPNGMLSVVQQVTIQNGGTKVSLGAGAAFGQGTTTAGMDLYALYKQNCR